MAEMCVIINLIIYFKKLGNLNNFLLRRNLKVSHIQTKVVSIVIFSEVARKI